MPACTMVQTQVISRKVQADAEQEGASCQVWVFKRLTAVSAGWRNTKGVTLTPVTTPQQHPDFPQSSLILSAERVDTKVCQSSDQIKDTFVIPHTYHSIPKIKLSAKTKNIFFLSCSAIWMKKEHLP